MATITNQDLLSNMASLVSNPTKAISLTFALLENLTDGTVRIVDASNPVAYLAEVSAASVAAAIAQSETCMRKMYPKMATTEADLYMHMSDADYVNRFSKAGTTVAGLIFALNELKGAMVDLNDGTGTKQLIIPKHTQITLAGYVCTTQYPIYIKLLYNGTLIITMDTSVKSPMYTPVTNVVYWATAVSRGTEYIVIDIPVQQVKLSSQTIQLTSFTGFSKSIAFDDYFNYCRAYTYDNTSMTWTEINVTHSSLVYDPETPTLCVQVLNQVINTYIPQIYFQNDLITDAVRIDIYTTKGPVTIDLTTSDSTNYGVKFQDLDSVSVSKYSAPLDSLANIEIIGRSVLTGGSGPITFAQMRRRLVNRSQVVAGLPVTTNQLGGAINDAGFELVSQLDNVTERQYCATRQVDPPTDDSTVTGLACCIQMVEIKMSDLASDTQLLEGVSRVTIPPDTLFENVNGTISIVPAADKLVLKQQATSAPDALANIVNSRIFYYTPYHYVLDNSSNIFTVRPYYLAAPSVLSRSLVQQNTSFGLNLVSDGYSIALNPDGTGYILIMTLNVNSTLALVNYTQVSAQISYLIGSNSAKRAFIKGTLISPIDPSTNAPLNNKWQFQFNINSNFDIDSKHMLSNTDTGYSMNLEETFQVALVVKDYNPNQSGTTDIDNVVSVNAITNYSPTSTYIGVSQEEVIIKFGDFLDSLWRRARTVESTIGYKRYVVDVPAVYTETIYERDVNGNYTLNIDVQTGKATLTVLHNVGDPIMDVNGNPVYLHRAGEYVTVNGEYVPLESSVDLTRQLDLFLVDGRYYFANATVTTNYVSKALSDINGWLTNDIPHLQQRLLERTDLFYYPRAGIGYIDVMTTEGALATLPANMSLEVTYYLRKEKMTDSEVTTALTNKTAATINAAINAVKKVIGTALTKNDIIQALKTLFQDDIIDVDITGFMGDLYNAILITDLSSLPAIGKKLQTQSNFTLKVVDDVNVTFKSVDDTSLAITRYGIVKTA